jgi:hypothetical protein
VDIGRILSALLYVVLFVLSLVCYVRERAWSQVMVVPVLTWALHGLIYSAVLWGTFATMNGHWSQAARTLFNTWSSALRLHGELSALVLLLAFAQWSKRNGVH